MADSPQKTLISISRTRTKPTRLILLLFINGFSIYYMISPNDPTAKFLDIVYQEYSNKEQTGKEVNFIASQTPKQGSVLDLGCGTGRHVIPLLRRGYTLTGIDGSREMLNILREKLKENNLKADLIHHDITSFNRFDRKFDTVICFWNAFCEMAATKKDARRIFDLVFKFLNDGGRFIIEENINPDKFDPKNNDFESTVVKDGYVYETKFTGLRYDKKTNTTTSKEHIVVKKDGKIVKDADTLCVLRWWKKKDLEGFCKDAGFSRIGFYGDNFLPLKEPVKKLILVAMK